MRECKTSGGIYALKEDGIHLGDDAYSIFPEGLVHFGIDEIEYKGYFFNLITGKSPEKEKYNNRTIEDGKILPPQKHLDKLWLRDGYEVLVRERRLSKVSTIDIWNYDDFKRFTTLLYPVDIDEF